MLNVCFLFVYSMQNQSEYGKFTLNIKKTGVPNVCGAAVPAQGCKKTLDPYRRSKSVCDVLPHVCKLSLIFQQQEVDLTVVQSQVNATLACIGAYKDNPGPNLTKLDAELNSSLQDLGITARSEQKDQFARNIRKRHIIYLEECLKNRLPCVELLDAFSVFDPSQKDEDNTSRIQVLVQHYTKIAPPYIEEDAVKAEWELFKVLLSTTYASLPQYKLMRLLVANQTLGSLYPNLCKLAQICLILPVSTADCERAFSTMKHVKTPLRNRLNTKTLDALLRIRIEGPDMSDFDFELALTTGQNFVTVELKYKTIMCLITELMMSCHLN